jgi:hypothetical protein
MVTPDVMAPDSVSTTAVDSIRSHARALPAKRAPLGAWPLNRPSDPGAAKWEWRWRQRSGRLLPPVSSSRSFAANGDASPRRLHSGQCGGRWGRSLGGPQ